MLNIPRFERKLTDMARKELTARLGVPVQIGSVDVDWLNRLVLEDFYLEDQQGDVLLQVNHVTVGFRLLPLARGKLVFTTVRLFGFALNLNRDASHAPLNLQFVIDALAGDSLSQGNPDIEFRFNSIMVRRGNFSYHVRDAEPTPAKFNARRIGLTNISANISLKALSRDSLNANVKKLSFEETSGFSVQSLSFHMVGNRDSVRMDNFRVRLDKSDVRISGAVIRLPMANSLGEALGAARMELNVSPSEICPRELSPFVPALKNFSDNVELTARISGVVDRMLLDNLTLRYGNKMFFSGKMEFRDLTRPGKTYLLGQVGRLDITTDKLWELANNFYEQKIPLPEPIAKMGRIRFNGEVSGFLDRLVAFGLFSSPVGSIRTDVIFGKHPANQGTAFFVKGDVTTDGIDLGRLLPAGNPYGTTRFDIHLDAAKLPEKDMEGTIRARLEEFNYMGYKYENILLLGQLLSDGFSGILQVDDPNGHLKAEGTIRQNGKNSLVNFTAGLHHFRPDRLHLTNRYEDPEIDLTIDANFTGNNIDNLEGGICVNDLSFKTAPGDLYLKRLEVLAGGHAEERKLTVTSDLLNGEISGAYSFETIVSNLMNTLRGYLPALAGTASKRPKTAGRNDFSLLFTIDNTDTLSAVLKLPFAVTRKGRITGEYSNLYDRFRLEAWLPGFSVGQSAFESGYLMCDNPNGRIELKLRASQFTKNGLKNYLDLTANASDDRVNTLFHWANNKEQTCKGDLSTAILFTQTADEKNHPLLQTDISIGKSSLTINDSLWTIPPANISVLGRKVEIGNLLVSRDSQHLRIDGRVSENPADTLVVDLRQMELSYIFDIVNIEVLQFGGKATGTVRLNDPYGNRVLNTDLEIQDFSFNRTALGRLNLFSEWDEAQKGILMLGSIYKNDSTWTDVNGYIYPLKPREGLSLYFDANDIDIAFLQPFLRNVAKNFRGRGFGNIHLHGPFDDLTVEGDAYVKDAGLDVELLNTRYAFSDSVHMDNRSIRLDRVTVHDKRGNTAMVDLVFNHEYFRDYGFDVDIQATNFLVYDRPEKTSPMIYGTAYGTGSAHIRGNEKLVHVDVNMTSEPQTAINLNFMNSSASAEYDFITFVDQNMPVRLSASPQPPAPTAEEDAAEYRMNFLLDLTPDATIHLVMDPVAGDRIRGNAVGDVQIQYGSKSDLRMYGGLNIVSGNYNFSLQQLIHRDFKIREGSSVDFRGDPYQANLNINAIYSLTANLNDLDQGLLSESPRANIPVDCVLNIAGVMRNPAISFDIELPGSDEELERQVKSLIDTDDMMTRQMVYLLVLNKFYTPEYATTEYSSNEWNAVASSAISSQISGILNSLTDKVQIGTNIRAAREGFSDRTEVEMLLSSQLLDNRLLFNGNFGYKNSYMMEQKNVFIGEFDLEYKLTPGGEFRLKAYNHTNDMYQYLRQSLTTQGVGILFRKDFTHPSELFRRKRRLPR